MTNNDIYSPQTGTTGPPRPNGQQTEITIGLNYLIKGNNAKIQAAYTPHNQKSTNGRLSADTSAEASLEGIFRLAFQVKY